MSYISEQSLEQSTKSLAKIRIKLESVEIDFEGTEDYIRNDLPNLFELICTYTSISDETESEFEEAEELPESSDPSKQKIEMTTNTIAAKLSVQTGPDLVIAACAHLCFVKCVDTFERKNILAEMQTASNYYKKSHNSNLSKCLSNLVKDGKLIERTKNSYALSATTKKELEDKLV